MQKNESQITIALKEYQRLLENSIKLECLAAMGVDNWDGHEGAMEMAEELAKEQKL